MLHAGPSALCDGPGRIDHIVQQKRIAAGYIADDVHHMRFVRTLASLVDNREIRLQPFGKCSRPFNPAGVRRHDHQIARAFTADIVQQDGHGIEMIHGDLKEALNLAGMQIHREDAVRAGCRGEIRHDFRGNRHARLIFSVLAPVSIIRNHRGNPIGRGPFQRINHEPQFHPMLVNRIAAGLKQKDIFAPHIFIDVDPDLSVTKGGYKGITLLDL